MGSSGINDKARAKTPTTPTWVQPKSRKKIMQELTPVLRLEDRTNRDDPREWENISMTIPDPALSPRLANIQYAPEDDPAGIANILDNTCITENNISKVKQNDRGERVLFVNSPNVVKLQTLATGENILTFRTPDDLGLKNSITALMQSRISVKKNLGEYVLLMGNNILTVYQDKDNNSQIEATQHSPRSPHRDNAAFTAFQPADMGVNPLPLRTQSPEGERRMIHHTTQAHAEPRQPTLYPLLPATDNSQPPEEDQREPAATVQQGIPAEAYGQQPSIDPNLTRKPYVFMGPPLLLRTT